MSKIPGFCSDCLSRDNCQASSSQTPVLGEAGKRNVGSAAAMERLGGSWREDCCWMPFGLNYRSIALRPILMGMILH